MLPNAWRYQRFHISYLLGWLCLGVLLGLLVGKSLNIDHQLLWIWIGLVVVLGAIRSQRWWSAIAILLAGVCFGSVRAASVQAHYDTYQKLFSKTIVLSGRLSEDPQAIGGGRQRVVISNVLQNKRYYPGEVFVTLYGTNELKRGDTITVEGKVREGFASFGASMSAGKVLSITRPDNAIRDVREAFATSVRNAIIEPMASLGLGFVVGQRSTLPESLDEQLKIVGLTHIVVASGYNLTILARFVMRLFARHSRYIALIISLIMVVLFALFSGFSPSMNRAVAVTILSLLAWYVGRRFHPILLVSFVAAGTALYNPMYAWADIGWYLSFFAFIGVLVVAPLIVSFLYKTSKPGATMLLIFETLAAEIMALPIIALAFSQMPALGLIANVLVAPFIPAAMALTALTGIGGMVHVVIADVFALPTQLLIGYIVAVVGWLSALPFAQRELTVDTLGLVGWYGGALLVCLIVWRKTGYNFRKRDQNLEA